MDRRKSIKTLLIGTVSTAVLIESCNPKDTKTSAEETAAAAKTPSNIDRMEEEKEYNKRLMSETFFTPGEMTTITILGDIIIPKDAVSGSASDAKVPDFIEFIVKDMPSHQVPLRGGLRWLQIQSLKRYEKSFEDITPEQRLAIVDEIAYPAKAKPNMKQGVKFFNLMRNLVVTGFYTSKIGVEDIGYVGNRPNQWNGVPDDVLKQYGLAYSDREMKECVSFEKEPGT